MAIITLRCIDCENDACCYSRKYFPYESLEGCTRVVSDEVADKHFYYMNEVAPFMNIKSSTEKTAPQYKKIIDFLFNEIYSAPIGQKLDTKGKVKGINL